MVTSDFGIGDRKMLTTRSFTPCCETERKVAPTDMPKEEPVVLIARAFFDAKSERRHGLAAREDGGRYVVMPVTGAFTKNGRQRCY